MQQKTLGHLILVGIGYGLNAFLGLLFLLAVAKQLDLATFGKYALLTSLLGSFSRLVDFGTNNIFVADHSESDEPLKSFISTKLILLVTALPISLITLLIYGFIDFTIVAVFLIGIVGYTASYYLQGLFQKEQNFLLLVLTNTFPALVKGFFAILIFAELFHSDITLAFSIFALSILTCAFLLPKGLAYAKGIKPNISKYIKDTVVAFPAGISQMIYEAWPAIQNTLTKLFGTFSDVGVFSLANKISNVFTVISVSIFTVLLPKNALRKKYGERYDIIELTLLSVAVIGFAIISSIAAKFGIEYFLGNKFAAALILIDILIWSNAILTIQNFNENIFYVENKTQWMMGINLSKLVVFILLGIGLTTVDKLTGIAMASLISNLAALTVTVVCVYKLKHTYK